MNEQVGSFLTILFAILSLAILVVPPYFMKKKDSSKRVEHRIKK